MTNCKRFCQYRQPFTCWHPLLPAFSARIIIALRILLGIAVSYLIFNFFEQADIIMTTYLRKFQCCAAFTLSQVSSKWMNGQLLISIGFIVSVKSTLGATIQTAARLWLGGAISAGYCLIIVNVFHPNILIGVGATNLFVFLIVYTEIPITVRRFSILSSCIILLQWFSNPNVNTFYVLKVWGALGLAGALAIFITFIPIPVIPTAYRELIMRMRFVAHQTRRELTALILLISEYHNIHVTDCYSVQAKRATLKRELSDDGGIEMPTNTFQEEDLCDHSASIENLKDDHLLSSDIQDLHALVNEDIKQMQRALTEIEYEPYFFFICFSNQIRRVLRMIPIFRKCIKPPSNLRTRLSVWTNNLAALHRIITAILSMDNHHRAFVGQRPLINAIALLLDATFNFLEATLVYTTSPGVPLNTDHIISCRTKVEDGLERFFQVYGQVRESTPEVTLSNTDSIRLNTFLLLTLRLVHVAITAAETSETPGGHLDIGLEQPINNPTEKSCCCIKQLFFDIFDYIGLKPSSGKLLRATKTSLSVLVSAVVALYFQDHLHANSRVYWAPMTTALVSEYSEGGTIRLSIQRLMAVLLGSTYAYIIVVTTQDFIISGIFIVLFVGLMGYIKTDERREYFANVCAQSASIITFLSNQVDPKMPDEKDPNILSKKAVMARTSLTFLGIFIHVVISNLLLPISARGLVKKKVLVMTDNVSKALKISTDDFCSFIGSSNGIPLMDSDKTSSALMSLLASTDRIGDNFSSLLGEALNEPNFWKRPFIQVKDRYSEMSKSLKRIILNIRFIHRCTTILKAESKLRFAQEAKTQGRRPSLAVTNQNTERKSRGWTSSELRKQKHVQNDLDVPLTIFMQCSSNLKVPIGKKSLISNASTVSLRVANIALYQPVLEQIRILEERIQNVIKLTGQLIEKQAMVDVGSFELQQLCREDSFETNRDSRLTKIKPLNRRPSFYPVQQFKSLQIASNYYQFCSCCSKNESNDNQPLPSLRDSVDQMFASLIDFLYANNHFIRTELQSIRSVGDLLAFHTLSYAFKDMVEATMNLAKNARRIKHIDTRTLVRTERDDNKIPPGQNI